MGEALLLVQLAGDAALLLWGLHMVQSGVMRAFGSRLRAALGVALGDRWRAFAAGLGVTAVLQSSTATALMISSFTAGGSVALVPGLAALLGANVGTALIVQALSFDVTAVFPLLILAGVTAFRRSERARVRDLGRAATGLGLMLLALHLMVTTMQPVEASPALRAVLAALADNPLANLAIAAVLAWAVHSSVAAVLFIASLAGAGVITPEAAIAMVAGANLGSAVNPLLEGDRGDGARARVPVGNLANRLIGCVLALALLAPLTRAVAWLDPAPARLVANAHLLFNLALAALSIGLLPYAARALERWLPDRPAGEDPAASRYLDEAALGTPPVALANAGREALRMADALESMLRTTAQGFRTEERDLHKRVRRIDDVLDGLNRAIQRYLSAIGNESLGEEDSRRIDEIRNFALNLEHAGDVVESSLAKLGGKRARRGVALDADALAAIETVHARLLEQLRLAVAVFMLEDVAAARKLIAEKESMREAEAEAARRFALAAGTPEAEAMGLRLEAVRDLRRVGGHLAATAHPLLERRGELRASRLAEPDKLADETLTPA